MPDPASIAAGLGSIKAALDLTKTIADARDTAKLLSIKLELKGLLLEAQEAQAALADQKRNLEERLRAFERWDAEAAKYRLTTIGTGTLAYAPDESAARAEPFHLLCAKCFQHRRKSILQRHVQPVMGRPAYDCNECGAQVVATMEGLRAIGAVPPKVE
jgi:hypothetical protein